MSTSKELKDMSDLALEYRTQKEEYESANKGLRLALLEKNKENEESAILSALDIIKDCIYEDPLRRCLCISERRLLSTHEGAKIYRFLKPETKSNNIGKID